MNDLGNSNNFATARSIQTAASSVTETAIQTIREDSAAVVGADAQCKAHPFHVGVRDFLSSPPFRDFPLTLE